MRLLYVAVIITSALFPGRLWGATITAVNSGNWTANSTWSCSCQPTNSDNIVIPAGKTVTSNGPVILFLGPVINITIGGTLVLNNGSLEIDSSDVINILSGGKITGTGLLGGTVYSGITPIFIASGSEIDGPKSITNGVMPIKLIYFKSTTVDEGIQLEWASTEEKDFDHYDIGRSDDGKSFTSIATISGKDENGAEYTFIDTSPLAATNYYKLTAVDPDGSRDDVQLTKGEWSPRRDWFTIYPNPIVDGNIHASFVGSGNGSLQLLDCNGLLIAERSLLNASSCDLELPASMPPGVYVLSAKIDGRSAQVKVIVR
jgi:hypothetical protein